MEESLKIIEINDIIAKRLNDKIALKEKFQTFELSLEIYNEFKAKEILETAILGYINKIIIDLLKATDFKLKEV